MDALGIDPIRLLWQIINFLILLFLLQRLLFKPILRLMDSRAAKIRESVDEAERMRQLAEETRRANEAAVEAAKKEANDIINAANHAANQMIESAKTEARLEAERLLERTRDELQLERDRAIAEVRHTAVDLAIMAASKVVGESLSSQQHYKLVQDFLGEAHNELGGNLN